MIFLSSNLLPNITLCVFMHEYDLIPDSNFCWGYLTTLSNKFSRDIIFGVVTVPTCIFSIYQR